MEKRNRDIYLLWEEKIPALIFEITSRKTRRDERLGVPELVLFDPYGDYLKPRLQGYRLEQGLYRKISPNLDGSLDLRTTGVTARAEGERLRLVDTVSGEKILWTEELAEELQAAEKRAAEEAAGRRAAEERARALAEELARLRGKTTRD